MQGQGTAQTKYSLPLIAMSLWASALSQATYIGDLATKSLIHASKTTDLAASDVMKLVKIRIHQMQILIFKIR